MPDLWTCDQFLEALQLALDEGDTPRGALAAAHRSACRNCRQREAAARALLAAYPPAPPFALAERLTRVVRDDRRLRAFRAYALTAGALAAMILGAVWLAGSSPPRPGDHAAAVPTLDDRFDDARSALAALTDRAKVAIPVPAVPNWSIGPWLDPDVAGLADARRGFAEGLEPVTSSAIRAASRLWHDLPVTD
jgi:hypothetical protein